MLPYPWCHLNYRCANTHQSLLCTLPVESTAAITSGCRRPLLTARSRFRGKLTGVRSGLILCAASTGPHSLQKNLEHLLFPINAFPACIVSRLFVRVNTVFAFLCGLPRMEGVLCAAAAQSVQNAALALQGEAVLRHQMSTHLIHKVAVQVIDAPALHALQVQVLAAVAALVHTGTRPFRPYRPHIS